MVWGKSQILVINRVRGLGSGPHTPTHFLGEHPSPGGGGWDLGRMGDGLYGYGKWEVTRQEA